MTHLQKTLATAQATVAEYGQNDGGKMADAVMVGLLRKEYKAAHRKPRAPRKPRVMAQAADATIHSSAEYGRDETIRVTHEVQTLQDKVSGLSRELEQLRRPRV